MNNDEHNDQFRLLLVNVVGPQTSQTIVVKYEFVNSGEFFQPV